MHACVYKRVRSFHWILLDIRMDAGTVQVMDSLEKEQKEYQSVIDMLQR
jgi:hypothetical protein